MDQNLSDLAHDLQRPLLPPRAAGVTAAAAEQPQCMPNRVAKLQIWLLAAVFNVVEVAK